MQQLLDQVLRARDAGLKLVETLGGLACGTCGAQVLDLQADGGHRRAQLVGRVLHEAPLRLAKALRTRVSRLLKAPTSGAISSGTRASDSSVGAALVLRGHVAAPPRVASAKPPTR